MCVCVCVGHMVCVPEKVSFINKILAQRAACNITVSSFDGVCVCVCASLALMLSAEVPPQHFVFCSLIRVQGCTVPVAIVPQNVYGGYGLATSNVGRPTSVFILVPLGLKF